VWLPPLSASGHPPGWVDIDGTVTIADSPATAVDGLYRLTRGGTVTAEVLQRGQCIGVVTPHGRVMVGDGWRRAPDHEFTVTAIASEDGEPWIKVRYAGGQQDHDFDARNLWDCDGYTRTRYAPARAGERYRAVVGRTVATVCQADTTRTALRFAGDNGPPAMDREAGWAGDPAQWERLDGGALDAPPVGSSIRIKRPASVVEAEHARAVGAADAESDVALRDRCITADWRRAAKAPGLDTAKGAALDAIAAGMGIERRPSVEPAFDYGGNIKGPPSVDMTVDHPRCRSVLVGTVDPGATLTLTGPARDLRALADAVGRALESAEPVAITFNGAAITVARDEMLFTPTHVTGFAPTAADQPLIPFGALAGDTRALAALRRCLLDAMASDDGRATLAQWGAKGPALVVRREGGGEPSMVAAEAVEATRYDGANGGADQWRWEVGE